jgi:tRNA pseudouridine38-40 synthase
MFAARCWRRQRFVLFCFVADAFLRHMVRLVVGTLLRIGIGTLPSESIAALLTGSTAVAAGPAAPAHGLYLVRVQY